MARSFAAATKLVSDFATSKISPAVTWRGYAAVSQSGVSNSGASPNVMLKKGSEEPSKISWVPDPVTGNYRPENQAKEKDAAELRAILIKEKSRRR